MSCRISLQHWRGANGRVCAHAPLAAPLERMARSKDNSRVGSDGTATQPRDFQ